MLMTQLWVMEISKAMSKNTLFKNLWTVVIKWSMLLIKKDDVLGGTYIGAISLLGGRGRKTEMGYNTSWPV